MAASNTKQKILLTGGAGFIGSHVAQAYLKAGYPVVIVDNLSTGKKENIPSQARFYQADVGDLKEMKKIFQKEKPAVVNHHASQIDVRFSVENPAEDARQNILGGLSLLDLSVKEGVQKWIFASTGGALYGEVPKEKAKENTPIRPTSPYGTSKYCFEKYLELYAKLYPLSYTILRYANVYGPRQIPKAEGGVIAVFIQAMLAQKNPTLFGDGDQKRDFVYVEDVAQANLKALNSRAQGPINIGTGLTTTILELFALLKKELKFKGNSKFAPKRPGEIYRSVLENGLAGKILAWSPQTELRAGLRETIRWQKCHRQV